MSGHSKWSKIKHQKAVTDVNKGKIFTKLGNAITIAVREGGGVGDPNSNFRLRLAIEKAKDANMPKDNIERAIEKGKGAGGGNNISEIIYEGYGPMGVAFLVETTTDNRARTTAEIKNLFDKSGGKLGEPGSVAFQFQSQGLIVINTEAFDLDEIELSAIDLGVKDLERGDGPELYLYTEKNNLFKIKEQLENKGYRVIKAMEVKTPLNTIKIENPNDAQKLSALVDKLEDLDEVQNVYGNYEIP